MESTAAPGRDDLLAFELALDERVCDEVRREPWGRLFLTPSTTLVWDANWVGIEEVGLSVEQVVAIADDALGGEGFGHRTVCMLDEADGTRIGEEVEAAAADLPRWQVERTRYMLWRGEEIEPVAMAREAPLAEIADLRKALIAELTPRTADNFDATVEQLFELNARYGRAAGDRWFVSPARSDPLRHGRHPGGPGRAPRPAVDRSLAELGAPGRPQLSERGGGRRCDITRRVSGPRFRPPEAGRRDVRGILVTTHRSGPLPWCRRGPGASGSGGGSRRSEFATSLCPLPWKPSRPGPLVAATACQGRHETPGTLLGRPPAPRTTPSL